MPVEQVAIAKPPKSRGSASAAVTVLRPMSEVRAAKAAFKRRSSAKNTRRAYLSQWRMFEEWCRARELAALPCTPETLADYLTERAAVVGAATVRQAVSAIGFVHKQAGIPDNLQPQRHAEVTVTHSGIRKTLGVAPRRRVAPLMIDALRTVVRALPNTLAGKRNRALIAIGFSGALRRSEVVALCVSDVTFTPEGLMVLVRRSKTDQYGKGTTLALPSKSTVDCPARALRAWLKASGVHEGPIFRSLHNGRMGKSLSDRSVASIVQRAAAAAGLDGDFAGHSLRAGLATSAARAGKHDRDIQSQGRWANLTTLSTYVRHANLFGPHNAADGL